MREPSRAVEALKNQKDHPELFRAAHTEAMLYLQEHGIDNPALAQDVADFIVHRVTRETEFLTGIIRRQAAFIGEVMQHV